MRIDKFLAQKFGSRAKAAQAICRGQVLYNNKVACTSQIVKDESLIQVLQQQKVFVSNGGYKLDKAFTQTNFSANGLVCLDIGASTGGFTDCLLQSGARLVYCVDVGASLLDKTIAQDNRVAIFDNTNAKNLHLGLFSQPPDVIVCDVSFISITKILPILKTLAKSQTVLFLLIKPQFEADRRGISKRGIVLERQRRMQILNFVAQSFNQFGFDVTDIISAPIIAKKNIEYVFKANLSQNAMFNKSILDKLV